MVEDSSSWLAIKRMESETKLLSAISSWANEIMSDVGMRHGLNPETLHAIRHHIDTYDDEALANFRRKTDPREKVLAIRNEIVDSVRSYLEWRQTSGELEVDPETRIAISVEFSRRLTEQLTPKT